MGFSCPLLDLNVEYLTVIVLSGGDTAFVTTKIKEAALNRKASDNGNSSSQKF